MVLQKAVDNLKDKPKDERTAVAGGVAITVVIILFIAWGIFFFRRIQNGTQEVNLSGGAQDQFNFTSVKQAQQQLQNTYNAATQDQQDLQDIRNNAASGQAPGQQEMNVAPASGSGADPFGSPGSSN